LAVSSYQASRAAKAALEEPSQRFQEESNPANTAQVFAALQRCAFRQVIASFPSTRAELSTHQCRLDGGFVTYSRGAGWLGSAPRKKARGAHRQTRNRSLLVFFVKSRFSFDRCNFATKTVIVRREMYAGSLSFPSMARLPLAALNVERD
jgi:hypothetical protein